MCSQNCPQENYLGDCTYNLPGRRPCAQEAAAYTDATLTDNLCPICLLEGRDHNYLYEDQGDALHCAVCDKTLPAGDWLMLFGAALNRVLDDIDTLRSDLMVTAAERNNLQIVAARALAPAESAATLLREAV